MPAFAEISRTLRRLCYAAMPCVKRPKHSKKRGRQPEQCQQQQEEISTTNGGGVTTGQPNGDGQRTLNEGEMSIWDPTYLDNLDVQNPEADQAPKRVQKAIKPLYSSQGECIVCYEAGSDDNILMRACHYDCMWCPDSLRTLFTRAINCSSDMPPRCCGILIPLHYGLQYLTNEEAADFRIAFEEWATPGKDRLYCPATKCQKFIPMRTLREHLLACNANNPFRPLTPPKHSKDIKKDSNEKSINCREVNKPPVLRISCPYCDTDICLKCKTSHDPIREPCGPRIDSKLIEQVRGWGYKSCPRCGHYIKRMHGCSHMLCVCGEHWCWGCERRYQDCEGYGECEQEDYGEDAYSMAGTDDGGESVAGDSFDNTLISVHNCEPAFTTTEDEDDDSYEAYLRVRQAIESGLDGDEGLNANGQRVRPRRRRRRGNLDAGTHAYWAEQGCDFGGEPGDDDHATVIWDNNHYWTDLEGIPDAKNENFIQTECHICWRVLHPATSLETDEIDDAGRNKGNQCRLCRVPICDFCRPEFDNGPR